MTKPDLGMIGLGRMGTPMATRLLAAGYRVTVYDPLTAAVDGIVAKGAQRADSPRAVGDAADVVFASLPTPQVVESAVLGTDGISHGSRVRIFVDLSTTGPGVSAQVAAALAKTGRIVMVDCPVSGGVAGAVKGSLTLMVAGPRPACDEIAPALHELGRAFFCGDQPGQGQMLKLANNLMSVAAMAVSCEALVLCARAGLDPKVMIDVINVSSGRNGATLDKFPKHILSRTFDFGFSTALSQKDIRLCLDEAEALGVPMLMGNMARQVLAMTKTAFGPEADFTNMLRVFERLAGVEVARVDSSAAIQAGN